MSFKKILKVGLLICCVLVQASDGSRNLAFNAAGSTGTAFGGGTTPGFWYINPIAGNNLSSEARCIKMQGNKILVGGYIFISSSPRVLSSCIVRLNANGTIDTTFGSGGIVILNSAFFGNLVPISADTTADNSVQSIAVQSDNKIVLATFNRINGYPQFCVVRLTENGSRDTTFNTAGAVPYGGTVAGIWYINGLSPSAFESSQAQSVIIQPDDKIIIAGQGTNPAPGLQVKSLLIVRLHSNGALDTTFNSSGVIPGMWYRADASSEAKTAYFGGDTGADTEAIGERCIGLTANGGIIVGCQLNSVGLRVGIVVLTSGGVVDTNFNTSGSATIGGTIRGYFAFLTSFGTTFSSGRCTSIALQPDGKILAAGRIRYSGIGEMPFCMRLTPVGLLDTTFNAAGTDPYGGTTPGIWGFTTTSGSIFNVASGNGDNILLDTAGRIIFTGLGRRSSPNPTTQQFVVCLTLEGVLNTAFNATSDTYIQNIPGIAYFYATTTSPFTGTSMTTRGSCTLNTGQILLAYRSTLSNGSFLFTVASLTNNLGILQDTAAPFDTGVNGLILTTTLDQSGKLLIGGYYASNAIIARYNVASDPVRDTSFNTDGVAIGDLTSTATINKIINAASNGYLVAGVSNINQFTTALYANNGTLNTDYGTSGIVREVGVGISQAYDMLLDDTDLAVAGVTNTNIPTIINYISSTGAPNTEIGVGGLEQFPNFGTGILYGVATTTGNNKYVAGQVNSLAFLRSLLDTTGLLQDTNPPFNTGASGVMYGGMLDADGKLVLCGTYNNVFTELRYTTTGGRDGNLFGADGVVQLPLLNAATGYAVAQDSAGNYYTAGESTVSSNLVSTLVKLDNTGDLEYAAQETGLGIGSARAVELNTDGTVVVGGQTTVNDVLLPTLINYTASGQKIPTFGTNGVQVLTTYGTGVVNGLSIISPASVAAVAQMSLKATLLQYGQSNDLLDELNNGF